MFKPECGRPIAELHQHYKGKDIYIFGTGPSLLNIQPDEFQQQVCFGVNFAFEHMPHIDYHFAHVVEVYEALKHQVDPSHLVLSETLVHQWYRNPKKRKHTGRIAANCPEALVYPLQDPAERQLGRKHVSLDIGARMFTWSTTTHSAIHVAAYMGAQRIFLIGMDYLPFASGSVHFNSAHFRDYGQQEWNAFRKHQQGDEWLAQQLKRAHGIEVINLSRQYRTKRIGTVA